MHFCLGTRLSTNAKKCVCKYFIYLTSKEKDVYLVYTSDISIRPYFEQKLASVEVVYL